MDKNTLMILHMDMYFTPREFRDAIFIELGLSKEFWDKKGKKGFMIPIKQVTEYALKTYFPKLSSGKIGELMGGLDHATILYNVKHVTTQLEVEKSLTQKPYTDRWNSVLSLVRRKIDEVEIMQSEEIQKLAEILNPDEELKPDYMYRLTPEDKIKYSQINTMAIELLPKTKWHFVKIFLEYDIITITWVKINSVLEDSIDGIQVKNYPHKHTARFKIKDMATHIKFLEDLMDKRITPEYPFFTKLTA